MGNRTFASVTEEECKCGFLEQAAQNPDLPITFDKSVNEFHFEFDIKPNGGKAFLVVFQRSCL